MIPLLKPPHLKDNERYITQALASDFWAGDGPFTEKCSRWFEERLGTQKALLTTSATASLEMMAMLSRIQPGDEIIMPSFTFSSTATAFVLVGAKLVFVDINSQTMNIDEEAIENAITPKTKGIVVVHYAGLSCDMDKVSAIAQKNQLFLYEDAAQAMLSSYNDKPLGAIGDFGCFSFQQAKNFTTGEGGLLLIKNEELDTEARLLRDTGNDVVEGSQDPMQHYDWRAYGSSYLISDLLAAVLWPQLKHADEITAKRRSIWNRYKEALSAFEDAERVLLPHPLPATQHNGHMYYLILPTSQLKKDFVAFMRDRDICVGGHYHPLHVSRQGKLHGRFAGEDRYTSSLSSRLVRLPLYYDLSDLEQDKVIEETANFLSSY